MKFIRPMLAEMLEEIFPIFPFFKHQKRILDEVGKDGQLALCSKRYGELDADSLSARIKEEHERAIKIDEKTSKFILGLSVSLTVLAAASGSLVKILPNSSYSTFISLICGMASLYMLVAGITALGAIKTLATYGYGTDHLLNQKTRGVSYLTEALYAQERMNIIRQMRNEAAYQSLRNGFLLLLFALGLSVVVLSNANGTSKPTGANVEEPLKGSGVASLNKQPLVPDEKIDNE